MNLGTVVSFGGHSQEAWPSQGGLCDKLASRVVLDGIRVPRESAFMIKGN